MVDGQSEYTVSPTVGGAHRSLGSRSHSVGGLRRGSVESDCRTYGAAVLVVVGEIACETVGILLPHTCGEGLECQVEALAGVIFERYVGRAHIHPGVVGHPRVLMTAGKEVTVILLGIDAVELAGLCGGILP